ncbi:MAG TPA: ester cyclase [Solirubrobacteraceae bacterium]|nr:ester cyclase [Solirubrobacteraceae bacterium]
MNRRQMLARRDDVIAAWNRHDPDAIVAHVAEDVIVRDVAFGRPLLGRSALKEAVERYIAAFPDLRVEITSSTLDGSRVVQEWTVTATHTGEFMGLEPTGRWTETYGATVSTYDEDGVVIEAAMYWNPLAILRQLGLPDQGPTVAIAMSTSSAVVAKKARAARAAHSGGASTRKSSPAAT